MMIGPLLFFLQAAIAAPPLLSVKIDGRTTSLPVVTTGKNATISGDKLATALGGSLSTTTSGRYTLSVGATQVYLVEGAPYARVDTTIIPLVDAPVNIGGILYVPFHVVSEIIPRVATGFLYDVSLGEIRSFSSSSVVRTALPVTPVSSVKPPPMAVPAVADATAVRSSRRSKRLVVVDAGHGGPDRGMTGPINGTPKIYEKHITLTVSKLLAQYLKDEGVDVLMTRTKDTLIALSDRGKIANKARGDVFVSVHVNATGQRGASGARDRGYETYFLAEAKTEEAARVARMENEAVRFETGANAPKGDPLSFILKDMAQNEHLRESNELAQLVQDEFKTFHPGRNRGVQQANFAVLRGSFMPAVLVEIGFGTHTEEARFISDADNQRTIAKSIAKAVLEYLDRYEARLQTGAK